MLVSEGKDPESGSSGEWEKPWVGSEGSSVTEASPPQKALGGGPSHCPSARAVQWVPSLQQGLPSQSERQNRPEVPRGVCHIVRILRLPFLSSQGQFLFLFSSVISDCTEITVIFNQQILHFEITMRHLFSLH